MAESQPVKKKRRIRPGSAQTIRERTQQAQDIKNAEPKPKRLVGVRAGVRGFFTPLLFILRIIKWLGRHVIPRYFRNAYKELRQVTWPGRKQSRQLTTAVILFAIVFATFIALLDLGLDKIFKRILIK